MFGSNAKVLFAFTLILASVNAGDSKTAGVWFDRSFTVPVLSLSAGDREVFLVPLFHYASEEYFSKVKRFTEGRTVYYEGVAKQLLKPAGVNNSSRSLGDLLKKSGLVFQHSYLYPNHRWLNLDVQPADLSSKAKQSFSYISSLQDEYQTKLSSQKTSCGTKERLRSLITERLAEVESNPVSPYSEFIQLRNRIIWQKIKVRLPADLKKRDVVLLYGLAHSPYLKKKIETLFNKKFERYREVKVWSC